MHYPFKKYGHVFTRLDIFRKRDISWKIEFAIEAMMQAAKAAIYAAKLGAIIATPPRELRKDGFPIPKISGVPIEPIIAGDWLSRAYNKAGKGEKFHIEKWNPFTSKIKIIAQSAKDFFINIRNVEKTFKKFNKVFKCSVPINKKHGSK